MKPTWQDRALQGEAAGCGLLFSNAPGWRDVATPRGQALPRTQKVTLLGGTGTTYTQGSLNPPPLRSPLDTLPWATHPLPQDSTSDPRRTVQHVEGGNPVIDKRFHSERWYSGVPGWLSH